MSTCAPSSSRGHRGRLQRRDVAAGTAEDVAQRLFGHRRSPLLAYRVGVGEGAEQQGGARPGGPVHRGRVTTSGVVIEAS
jgi:hypothetical protein